eukprot:353350-Chlamydomonas_euryale.AAC.13
MRRCCFACAPCGGAQVVQQTWAPANQCAAHACPPAATISPGLCMHAHLHHRTACPPAISPGIGVHAHMCVRLSHRNACSHKRRLAASTHAEMQACMHAPAPARLSSGRGAAQCAWLPPHGHRPTRAAPWWRTWRARAWTRRSTTTPSTLACRCWSAAQRAQRSAMARWTRTLQCSWGQRLRVRPVSGAAAPTPRHTWSLDDFHSDGGARGRRSGHRHWLWALWHRAAGAVANTPRLRAAHKELNACMHGVHVAPPAPTQSMHNISSTCCAVEPARRIRVRGGVVCGPSRDAVSRAPLLHASDPQQYACGSVVQDVYSAVAKIKAEGGKVTRDAGPVKGGNTVIAFVEDPTGYKWELLQRGTTPEPLCQVRQAYANRLALTPCGVMLRVKDLTKSIAWYRDVLGMELVRERENQQYKYNLGFMGYGPEDSNAVVELTWNYDPQEYTKGNAYSHVTIATTDLKKTAEAIRQAGAEILSEDSTSVTTQDPDGYRFAFAEQK